MKEGNIAFILHDKRNYIDWPEISASFVLNKFTLVYFGQLPTTSRFQGPDLKKCGGEPQNTDKDFPCRENLEKSRAWDRTRKNQLCKSRDRKFLASFSTKTEE